METQVVQTQENSTFDFKALIVLLLKKWYWFFLSCVVAGALGVIYYMSTAPKYLVDAQVLLRSGEEAVSVPGSDMLQLIGLGGSKRIDDEIAMMTSRDIIMETIRELDIQTSYAKRKGLRWDYQYGKTRDLHIEYPLMFLDTTKKSIDITLKVRKKDYQVVFKTKRFRSEKFIVSNLNAPFETTFGPVKIEVLQPLKTGAQYKLHTSAIIPLVKYFSKIVTVSKLKKESAIVQISTTTSQTEMAIDFINKLVELYNANAVIDQRMKTTTTAKFIGERLEFITRELETAEADFEQYKMDNNITNVATDMQIYLTESTEYRHRIEALETQMKLVEYVEHFVRDEKNKDQLIPANLGITDEALARLINQYDDLVLRRMRIDRTATDSNPVVIQLNDQLAVMRSNILSSIRSVKNSLKISKADMENLSLASNQKLSEVPSTERAYVEKVRNKELQQKLYLYLYQKREENALSLVAAVPPANITVRAQADPKRVSPRLRYIGIFCLLLGLGLPFGIIYLVQFLNNKIMGRKQFEDLIKVPYVGELLNDPNHENIIIGDGMDSTAAELFRLLRTNIQYLLEKDNNKVVLVTSCINDEGKTYIATNLAMSLALLDKRVALVELDLRNPSIAKIFGVSNHIGASKVLQGANISIEDMMLSTGLNKNIQILPAGATPLNPNELLQSQRLDQLFAILRKQYDFIIVDSAPAAMVSDTFVISRISDLSLMVARVGVTTLDMVEFANQLAEHKRMNNMVSVLNAVNRDDLPYSHAYGYYRKFN